MALILPKRIFLTDLNKPLVDCWNVVFKDDPRISVVYGDYFDIPADAMVSPANCFGIMDGGIDLAIRNVLGKQVEERVQDQIRDQFHGELPIGSAVRVASGHQDWPHLIAAPTMRIPEDVRHTLNAYSAFRAVMMTVDSFNRSDCYGSPKIESIVCCGLATGCGKMSATNCALQMKAAWDQVNGSAQLKSFSDIHKGHTELFAV